MATAKKPAVKKKPAGKTAAPSKAKEKPEVGALKPLMPMQAMFVSEYLKDRRAGPAAARAGYSAKTADQLGYQLLQNPSVRAAIDAGMEKLLTDNGLTANRVLQEMARLAFFDPAKLYDEHGELKNVADMDPDTRAAISSIEVSELAGSDANMPLQTRKVKLTDKPAALRMAAQHFGLLKEHVEITGKDGGPIEMRELSDTERAVRLAALLAKAKARAPK